MSERPDRERVIPEKSVALINALRRAVNLTDGLQVPVIAGAAEKYITEAYDAGRRQGIEDAATVADSKYNDKRYDALDIGRAIRELKVS